jgi:hypothetical protein
MPLDVTTPETSRGFEKFQQQKSHELCLL